MFHDIRVYLVKDSRSQKNPLGVAVAISGERMKGSKFWGGEWVICGHDLVVIGGQIEGHDKKGGNIFMTIRQQARQHKEAQELQAKQVIK